MSNVAYYLKDNFDILDFFKRVYTFSSGMVCTQLKSIFWTDEIIEN